MFFGDNAGYLICHDCKNNISLPDKFLDIPCWIVGNKGVQESIDAYY